MEGADPDLKKQFELMEFLNKDINKKNNDQLSIYEEQVKALEKYKGIEVRDVTQDAEIVFMDEHICNDNLKKKDKDEGFLKPEEIVEDHEKSKLSLKELEKVRIKV